MLENLIIPAAFVKGGQHNVVRVADLVEPPPVAVAFLQGKVRLLQAGPLVELDDTSVQLVAAVGHARGQGLKLVPLLGQVQIGSNSSQCIH